ncbi:MAG: hypothetical protein J7K66_03325 [Anaerolineaceae bacterium]|nr:hypothetical protein [Anaerolineaceae bacterium]
MNEKRKAHVIIECLDEVRSGRMSRDECVQKYPGLAEELQAIFYSSEMLSSIQFPEIDPLYIRKQKIKLMQKLPDRENLVTKAQGHRYSKQKYQPNSKRRLKMTWAVILTTILSLISGAGAVFASSDALPGDTLYPVKTWVENVELAIAPENADTDLYMLFTEHRVEEAIKLINEGRFEDLDKAVDGYQKHAELLTKTMERLQAEDPEEAIKLRLKLEEKLQEQAQLMEAYIKDGEDVNLSLQEQIGQMLETNTGLSQNIRENGAKPKIAAEGLGENMGMSPGENESTRADTEDTQNKNGNGSPLFEVDDEEGTLKFGLGSKGEGGVYAEIDGARFDCTVEGDTATCDINGASQKGNVNLYNKKTNQLLFSYAYEYANDYAWDGEKNDNGNSGKNYENDNNGKEMNKSDKNN